MLDFTKVYAINWVDQNCRIKKICEKGILGPEEYTKIWPRASLIDLSNILETQIDPDTSFAVVNGIDEAECETDEIIAHYDGTDHSISGDESYYHSWDTCKNFIVHGVDYADWKRKWFNQNETVTSVTIDDDHPLYTHVELTGSTGGGLVVCQPDPMESWPSDAEATITITEIHNLSDKFYGANVTYNGPSFEYGTIYAAEAPVFQFILPGSYKVEFVDPVYGINYTLKSTEVYRSVAEIPTPAGGHQNGDYYMVGSGQDYYYYTWYSDGWHHDYLDSYYIIGSYINYFPDGICVRWLPRGMQYTTRFETLSTGETFNSILDNFYIWCRQCHDEHPTIDPAVTSCYKPYNLLLNVEILTDPGITEDNPYTPSSKLLALTHVQSTSVTYVSDSIATITDISSTSIGDVTYTFFNDDLWKRVGWDRTILNNIKYVLEGDATLSNPHALNSEVALEQDIQFKIVDSYTVPDGLYVQPTYVKINDAIDDYDVAITLEATGDFDHSIAATELDQTHRTAVATEYTMTATGTDVLESEDLTFKLQSDATTPTPVFKYLRPFANHTGKTLRGYVKP